MTTNETPTPWTVAIANQIAGAQITIDAIQQLTQAKRLAGATDQHLARATDLLWHAASLLVTARQEMSEASDEYIAEDIAITAEREGKEQRTDRTATDRFNRQMIQLQRDIERNERNQS